MTISTAQRNRQLKRHAIRIDLPDDQPVLWVGNEDDWKQMQELGSGFLKCPDQGCSVKFGIPRVSSRGLRYLQRLPNIGCDHAFVGGSDLGGGPPSERHSWMQSRLARICQRLGYETIIEDWHTQADVYVPSRSLAIEVQLRPTKFEERTNARLTKGANPIWFISPTTNSPMVKDALFRLPAVRLEVHSKSSRRKSLNPWEDSTLNPEARLRVFGTVAKLDAKSGSLYTGRYDAWDFLKEVLAVERVWYPPGTPGLPHKTSGAWVKQEHLQLVQSRLQQPISRTASAPARRPTTAMTLTPGVKLQHPKGSPQPPTQPETATTARPTRTTSPPTPVATADSNNSTAREQVRSDHAGVPHGPQEEPEKKTPNTHNSNTLLPESTRNSSKERRPRRWWRALFQRRPDL